MASTKILWLFAASGITTVFGQAVNPAATPLANPYHGFGYLGCYSDSQSDRTLGNQAAGSSENKYGGSGQMTIENCIDACIDSNSQYTYVGIEYNSECYCDVTVNQGAAAEPDSDCKNECLGNNAEACGGSNRISLYAVSGAAAPGGSNSGPIIPQNIGSGYNFMNCIADSNDYRAVSGAYYNPATSLEYCAGNCSLISGATYLGMDFYGECFCGSTLNSTGGTSSGCTLACNANSTEACGGINAVQVYNRTSFNAVSAASVYSASRAASRASVTTSRLSFQSVQSASRASVTSSRLSFQSVQSASRASVTTSRMSVSSVRAASRASVTSSRLSFESVQSASRASVTTSKLSVSSVKAASRASVTTSKLSLESVESVSRASVTTSRMSASSVASASRASVSASRASANSVASASRSAASVSRASANSVASASRSSASVAKAASVSSIMSSKSVASVSRASADSAHASSLSVADASLASVRSSEASSKSVASVSNASVKSVYSVSKASAASVYSASVASASAARAATMTTSTTTTM